MDAPVRLDQLSVNDVVLVQRGGAWGNAIITAFNRRANTIRVQWVDEVAGHGDISFTTTLENVRILAFD